MNAHNRLNILDGYRHGAPNAEAGAIDRRIAENMNCRKCGGPCRYDAYHRPRSYIALAVCKVCGCEEEF